MRRKGGVIMTVDSRDIAGASAGVQDFLSRLDVDLVGVARLDDSGGGKLEEQARKLLPGTRSVVVMALEVYPEFLDLATSQRTMGTANLNDLLRGHTEYLGGRLTRAAYDIARASRRTGLKALPLSSQGPAVDARFFQAVLSYKHAAAAAGLGTIGMSSLLVTPRFGPRVRLSACLTEAALEPTPAPADPTCRFCNICVSKCPSGALDYPQNGETYTINKFACRAYNDAAGGCSQCVRECPVASPIYD